MYNYNKRCPFHESNDCKACVYACQIKINIGYGMSVDTPVCGHPLKDEYEEFLHDVENGLLPREHQDAVLMSFVTGTVEPALEVRRSHV